MKISSATVLGLRCLSAFCCLFIVIPLEVQAFEIANGDFESGDFSGWTVFETPNGSLGGEDFPRCVDFDTKGDGHVSKSVMFKVGQRQYHAGGPSLAGGGMYTHVQLPGGRLEVSADIASSYSSPTDRRNLSGGMVELLIDGDVIASHDFGPIPTATTQREHVRGLVHLAAGVHEIRVRIQRPFRSLSRDHAPRQYLDNVQLNAVSP